jgi:hypothetical protein
MTLLAAHLREVTQEWKSRAKCWCQLPLRVALWTMPSSTTQTSM